MIRHNGTLVALAGAAGFLLCGVVRLGCHLCDAVVRGGSFARPSHWYASSDFGPDCHIDARRAHRLHYHSCDFGPGCQFGTRHAHQLHCEEEQGSGNEYACICTYLYTTATQPLAICLSRRGSLGPLRAKATHSNTRLVPEDVVMLGDSLPWELHASSCVALVFTRTSLHMRSA